MTMTAETRRPNRRVAVVLTNLGTLACLAVPRLIVRTLG